MTITMYTMSTTTINILNLLPYKKWGSLFEKWLSYGYCSSAQKMVKATRIDTQTHIFYRYIVER